VEAKVSDAPATSGGSPARIAYRMHLKPGRERSVRNGHPWVYSGAVERIEGLGDASAGELGDILAADGAWLALGTIHPQAALCARILRFTRGPIDRPWFDAALRAAARLRSQVVPAATDAYRCVHAEGDCLPGLIVDRYGDWLVVQCLTAGMAHLEPLWLPALSAAFPARGILERGERARRDVEIDRPARLLSGEAPPAEIEITEGAHRFGVRLGEGQKTGFYLDQRENRALIAPFARGRRVLDAFCYTGAFSVATGAAGAKRVVAIDTSRPALELAAENWRRNALPADTLTIERAPVQQYLRGTRERFDLIILDPPAFAKTHGQIEGAARAYKDLNLQALRRLAPGGYLATFSCSQHIASDLFQKILFAASIDAHVPLVVLRRLGAGPDHPVHLHHPQGEYLKGLLLRAAPGAGGGGDDGEGSVEP
jgi:23S rRNA (cytosine1962-C5)-methyltransferase